MIENRYPSFVIVGAMKSATSTLYDQLILQSGIYMPELKEPNFFSDDEQFSRGEKWYQSLFLNAEKTDLIGEASTHYTKLPTYPETISRMSRLLRRPKIIYIMRHPISRLISQYTHEWTMGNITSSLDEAVVKHSELTDYSRYFYQIEPYLSEFGYHMVLPVFFERLTSSPQAELERICRFIGYQEKPNWNHTQAPSNVSRDRIRRFPLYDLVVENSLAQHLRRTLIPKSLRHMVKRKLQMREKPILNKNSRLHLEKVFNEDLFGLGALLGAEIDCENYSSIVSQTELNWVSSN